MVVGTVVDDADPHFHSHGLNPVRSIRTILVEFAATLYLSVCMGWFPMDDARGHIHERMFESLHESPKAHAVNPNRGVNEDDGYGAVTREDVGPWEDAYTLWYYYWYRDFSLERLARQLGCRPRSVSRWLHFHDIPIREGDDLEHGGD
jgi:hypothetical protein